jgi:hypothetical protein
MISNNEKNEVSIVLIDFGLCQKFVNSDGEHVSIYEETQTFFGNILFSSLHQMELMATSRKNDLESLMYLMFYMLNDQNLPNLQTDYNSNDFDVNKVFKHVMKLKTKTSLIEMS